jgi:nitrite reductase/ring-hydroxylating ferredoxin subunit
VTAREQAGATLTGDGTDATRSAGAGRLADAFELPVAWWPIGISAEVTARPRAARLGARSVVAYRDGGGAVHALLDRCPHRRLPLSKGRVTGDGLQCGYHGWTFDGAGQCTLIPNFGPDESPSSRIQVEAYPAAEAEGLVFLWTGGGEPRSMAEAGLTQGSRAREPGGAALRIAALVRSPYQQVMEVLLHNPGAWLGLGLLFGAGAEVFGPELVPGDERAVTVRRERRALVPPRISTFDPPFDGYARSALITTIVATGTTEVIADGPGGGVFRAVIGLAPEGPHRTAVCGHVRAHGAQARALLAAGRPVAAGRRLTGRAVRALEAATDVAPTATDPALDRLRALRADAGLT